MAGFRFCERLCHHDKAAEVEDGIEEFDDEMSFGRRSCNMLVLFLFLSDRVIVSQRTFGCKASGDLKVRERDQAEDWDEYQKIILRVELHIAMAFFIIAVMN